MAHQQVSKVFRNEGIDSTHHPEFTTVEFYEVYIINPANHPNNPNNPAFTSVECCKVYIINPILFLNNTA